MKPSLFQRLVAASGLSPIFAEDAMRRALRRAHLDEGILTRTQIQQALPDLLRVIEAYIPDETDAVAARFERLED
jgi:hypothetical protein